jgi:hypothetical protein
MIESIGVIIKYRKYIIVINCPIIIKGSSTG